MQLNKVLKGLMICSACYGNCGMFFQQERQQ